MSRQSRPHSLSFLNVLPIESIPDRVNSVGNITALFGGGSFDTTLTVREIFVSPITNSSLEIHDSEDDLNLDIFFEEWTEKEKGTIVEFRLVSTALEDLLKVMAYARAERQLLVAV